MANNLNPIAESIQFFGNELLAQLKSNLVFSRLVTTDYSGAAEAPGSVVNVPYITSTGSASTRTSGGSATASDVISGQIPITLQQIYYAVTIDNLQRTFSNSLQMDRLAAECAYRVGEKATGVIAGLWNKMPYETGTANGGTAFATDVNAINAARKILMQNQCPMDGSLNYVLNPSEAYNLRALSIYQQAAQAGDASGLRDGDLKPFFGVKGSESQLVANATTATAAQWGASPLVNNAAGYAIGTTSIAVDALGTGTVPKGSSFQLGSYRYVVTADATITANAATLSIYPALKEAVVDNQALTVTAHSAAQSQNFALHPSAIIAVARPSAEFIPGTGVQSYTFTDPDTGFGYRLSFQSQLLGGAGTAMSTSLAVDFVFGAEVVRPELAVRITGQV